MSFSVDSQELSDLVRQTFENTQAVDVKSTVIPNYEDNFGGMDGLLFRVDVDKDVGISSKDVGLRMRTFGVNRIEEEPPEPLWKLMFEALQDPTLIFLSAAAFFSLFIALFVEKRAYGWLEGVAILCAVIVVVLVGSINDYQKELQFRELNSKKADVQVTVLRDGQFLQISTYDLVVGDVVLLSTGDLIPADGIVIGRNDLEISEKMLTGETLLKRKTSQFVISGGEVKSSPTLFAGTFVQSGEGRMMVLAVGLKTYQGSMEQRIKEADPGRSILQRKLDAMTATITTLSLYVSILLVLILGLRMAYGFYARKCCMEEWRHDVHWSELLGFIITGITIFVVAVPEGLPLAVTIALAFSVKRMLMDNNLVRHLSACETMGGATTICSDKTGTLTTSRMAVARAWAGGRAYADPRELAERLPPALRDHVCAAAVVNTMGKTRLHVPVSAAGGCAPPMEYCGNDTECALLLLSNLLGQPYEAVRSRHPVDHPARRCFSFTPERKRMTTVVAAPPAPHVHGGSGGFVAYCKGAPEVLAPLCSSYWDASGALVPLDAAAREEMAAAAAVFSEEGLRTLLLTSRALPPAGAAGAVPRLGSEEAEAAWVERELEAVCVVGLEDPVRPEVPAAMRDCRRAGIVVRMVTGDGAATAAAVARRCGILSERDGAGAVMDGREFRERVCAGGAAAAAAAAAAAGGGGGGAAGAVVVQEEFDKVWPGLRVLARSTPLDKYLLVAGLQASRAGGVRQTVAVTGDGTNDAPALRKADVGFAMGLQGTEVAKSAADVIIMDDSFASVVAAVRWGRCVYDNICKFLQFQLTVNVTACLLACVGAAVLTESPLSPLQMLWVNLIMDSMASLALATEGPGPALLDRRPHPRDAPVLSRVMVRNIVCHAAYQLALLSALLFLVGDVCHGEGDVCEGQVLLDRYGSLRSGRPPAFDLAGLEGACPPPHNASDPSTEDGRGRPLREADFCATTHAHEEPTRHYTLVFNVFVLLQLFNEVNARKIHGELNVFAGLARDRAFLAVVAATLAVQAALVQAPGLSRAVGCAPLTGRQWLASLLLGSSSIPAQAIFSLVPPSLFPAGGGGLPADAEADEATGEGQAAPAGGGGVGKQGLGGVELRILGGGGEGAGGEVGERGKKKD